MEIGFENVMLPKDTRAAHITCYIAKTLVKKLGHRCKNYCINELETASKKKKKTHVYIDLLSRRDLLYQQNTL